MWIAEAVSSLAAGVEGRRKGERSMIGRARSFIVG